MNLKMLTGNNMEKIYNGITSGSTKSGRIGLIEVKGKLIKFRNIWTVELPANRKCVIAYSENENEYIPIAVES